LILSIFDNDIELKSRNFTSNLVKLGLVDKNRIITSVGKSLMGEIDLPTSQLEKALPLKLEHYIFMRQLIKFKVYGKNQNNQLMAYSPFNLLIALLQKNKKIDESSLFQYISLLTPYLMKGEKDVINSFFNKSLVELTEEYNEELLSRELNLFPNKNILLDKNTFKNNNAFKNSKKGETENNYYEFYLLNKAFSQNKDQSSLDKLLDFIDVKTKYDSINKRFNGNKKIFKTRRNGSRNIDIFMKENSNNPFYLEGSNNNFYVKCAILSNRKVAIDEYSKSFEKLLKICNIITVRNQNVTLTFPRLWLALSKSVNFQKHIFEMIPYTNKSIDELNINSEFIQNVNLEQIFHLNSSESQEVVNIFRESYGNKTVNEINVESQTTQNENLISQLCNIMPKDKLTEILPLFISRNDKEIQKLITKNASIPTIFEWIVAISWYYISDEKYNLLKSMNLALDTDMLPISQAGGQKNKNESNSGDVNIEYEDRVVQLEATLMDKNNIKKGEWEPVLRHSVNLTASTEKAVQTYFITSFTDTNTENIWRSVAQTDLEETAYRHRKVRVIIYPMTINDLISWLNNNSVNEKSIWNSINKSYSPLLSKKFDNNWKREILGNINNV